jgi:hypothetical protein
MGLFYLRIVKMKKELIETMLKGFSFDLFSKLSESNQEYFVSLMKYCHKITDLESELINVGFTKGSTISGSILAYARGDVMVYIYLDDAKVMINLVEEYNFMRRTQLVRNLDDYQGILSDIDYMTGRSPVKTVKENKSTSTAKPRSCGC